VINYDPRWARALHEASHAIVALCMRQVVPTVAIDDPERSYCARFDPQAGSARDRIKRSCVFWYAGAIMCELTFGTADGCGANGDIADARRALDTLPIAERREVARGAWLLSKRLVFLNEASIHALARQLYQTGRMDFRQILDLLRGQPPRCAETVRIPFPGPLLDRVEGWTIRSSRRRPQNCRQ
jgi:hypothetical protein